MAFSDAIKLAVKRKAHFKCCICQRHSVSLEVHHIIPQADGGADDEDNAAPLCPTCHAEYGANPEKRAAIRVQRDFWYDICERRYVLDSKKLDRIVELLEGDTAKDTGFQEFASRVTNTESTTHTRTVPASAAIEIPTTTSHAEVLPPTVIERVDATATTLTGEARAEGSTVHATVTNPEDDGDEEFQLEPRSEIEILEAVRKLFDQVWYHRNYELLERVAYGVETIPNGDWVVARETARELEARYKDDPDVLMEREEFEWGMIYGRLLALRWALGDEWESPDT